MELNQVLRKVRDLITLAEHESTPETEAQSARNMADRLMLKYAIDEATAEAARPAEQRSRPEILVVEVGPHSDIIGYLASVLESIATHCRCKVRHYTSTDYNSDGQYVYRSTVYGYASDLRYFEILYTTVRLHMVGALRPSLNSSESLDDNAYRLHNAGFNWLEIASMYGWSKVREHLHYRLHERGDISDELYAKAKAGKAEIWYNKETDEYKTNWQVGSFIKRAYYRAIEVRGEQAKKISAGGSATYRKSAARGYNGMIQQRLRKMRDKQTGIGTELVLRSNELEDFYREQNSDSYTRCPSCGKLSMDPYDCDQCGAHIKDEPKQDKRRGRATYKNMPFNADAYRIGAKHAESADLMAGNRMGTPANKPLS